MKKSGNNQIVATNIKIYSLVLVAAIVPLLTIWQVFICNNHTLDHRIFELITPYINEQKTAWMKRLSFLAHHRFLIPANLLVIALLLAARKRKTALTVLFTSLSSLCLMSLLKNLFQRNRPADALVQGITNYSFPSGHAFMGVAFYGLLIWLAMNYISEKKLKYTAIFLLVLLTIVIGFSRIYLRVHYTTDVIAGFGLGLGWLWGSINLAEKTWGTHEKVRA